MPTKVKFLIDKGTSDVFAYFPANGWAYSHIGQHSTCTAEYARECFPADPVQYADLLIELQTIGYKIEIVKDHIMFNAKQAIEAIQARINGEYDNEQLMKLGPLMLDTLEDIERIIQLTDK